MICSNDGLAVLDRQLADVFGMTRERTADDLKDGRLREQQRWLRDVRGRCATSVASEPAEPAVATAVACLSARYRVRVGELSEQLADDDQQARQPAPPPAGSDEDAADRPRHALVRIQSAIEREAAGGVQNRLL